MKAILILLTLFILFVWSLCVAAGRADDAFRDFYDD